MAVDGRGRVKIAGVEDAVKPPEGRTPAVTSVKKKTAKGAGDRGLAKGVDGKGRTTASDVDALEALAGGEGEDAQHEIGESEVRLTEEDFKQINTREGLIRLLRSKNVNFKEVLQTLRYQEELRHLQVELVKLQRWVQDKGRRIAILFEGRDAAGKGGTIQRFTDALTPRAMQVVALPKPTAEERGQWYFQRYSRQLPNAGEIAFFDRSWYNRAVVEPVNGFCTKTEYQQFIQQVPEYEHMLYEDGVTIIKFWFSISKEEQLKRFKARGKNPLKQWKLSPIDAKSQSLWDAYTYYKEQMFSKTHTSFSPWIIVRANNKQHARLDSIRYVLNLLPYAGKEDAKVRTVPDPNVVTRFHREIVKID